MVLKKVCYKRKYGIEVYESNKKPPRGKHSNPHQKYQSINTPLLRKNPPKKAEKHS
jgi:hypothetical protein